MFSPSGMSLEGVFGSFDVLDRINNDIKELKLWTDKRCNDLENLDQVISRVQGLRDPELNFEFNNEL